MLRVRPYLAHITGNPPLLSVFFSPDIFGVSSTNGLPSNLYRVWQSTLTNYRVTHIRKSWGWPQCIGGRTNIGPLAS